MLRKSFFAFLLLVTFVILPTLSFAQESVLESEPIADSAEALDQPSSKIFDEQETPEKAPWSWRDKLKDADPFLRDSSLKLNFRNFYFDRKSPDNADGSTNQKLSWAQGGSVYYKTGKLAEVFDLTTEVFTSQPLYAPDDKAGALVLDPDQDGYTVVGVINPRLEYQGYVGSFYRQRHDLPYINSQENRMTPNTFESYNVAFLGEGEAPPFQIGAGYIDKIKKRDADSFISMSEAAGVDGRSQGMPWAGARIRPNESSKIAAVNYVGLDVFNIFYTDAEYNFKPAEDWSLKSAVQFSEQRSIGSELLQEDFSTSMWGLQQVASYGKFLVRTAITMNDKGATMRSPYGTYPGYNSGITQDFNRAGEIAWKVGLSYDFSELLLEGLSVYSDYISGNRAVNDDKEDLPDIDEVDVNIDYRINEGALKDFWLRLRGGFVEDEAAGATQDYRIIINYGVPVI